MSKINIGEKIQNFIIIDFIGQGTHGTVYKVTNIYDNK